MKTINLFLLFLLLVIEGYSQAVYYPIKPDNISESDYNKGLQILKESVAQMQIAGDGIVSIDYWNFGIAYMKMGQSPDSIYNFLKKSKDVSINEFCEIAKAYNMYFGGLKFSTLYKTLGPRYELMVLDCNKIELSVPNIDPLEYAEKGGYDEKLILELDRITKLDQKYRLPYDSLKQKPLDLENLKDIEAIIQKYGYPGKSLVGQKYSTTAWLVIQHSELSTQERFLDVLHTAYLRRELDAVPLKMLIDRIYAKKFGFQIFGSQASVDVAKEELINEVKDKYSLNNKTKNAEAEKRKIE